MEDLRGMVELLKAEVYSLKQQLDDKEDRGRVTFGACKFFFEFWGKGAYHVLNIFSHIF